MQNSDLLSNDLIITTNSRGYLAETAKWAKFLAILGFIGCGLMAVAAFSLPFIMSYLPGNEMAEMGGLPSGVSTVLTIVYLGFAILMVFPCLYLFRFSTKMKTALLQSEFEVLDTSFSNLKSFFKFYGIMSIIMISFYVLLLIITILGATMFSSNF